MGIIFKKLKRAREHHKGFTLIIAVIFMAVVLSIGLSLGSLGYKQSVLASSSLESQYAFYAADAGLECALRADEQDNAFAYTKYNASTPDGATALCGGTFYTIQSLCYNGVPYHGFTGSCGGTWITSWKVPLAFAAPATRTAGTETRCAVVTIYKPSSGGTTYIFSQGYDVPCANIAATSGRYASRGLSASYAN
jgi:Tfp pilus assembly protein PilX